MANDISCIKFWLPTFGEDSDVIWYPVVFEGNSNTDDAKYEGVIVKKKSFEVGPIKIFPVSGYIPKDTLLGDSGTDDSDVILTNILAEKLSFSISASFILESKVISHCEQ